MYIYIYIFKQELKLASFSECFQGVPGDRTNSSSVQQGNCRWLCELCSCFQIPRFIVRSSWRKKRCCKSLLCSEAVQNTGQPHPPSSTILRCPEYCRCPDRQRKRQATLHWRGPLSWQRLALNGERPRIICAWLDSGFESPIEQGWQTVAGWGRRSFW